MGWGIGRTPVPRDVLRQAVIHVGVVVVAALVVLIAAAIASPGGTRECDGSGGVCLTAAQYTMIAGPPAILAAGGVAAFVRTYLVWRRGGPWMVWQAAGWFQFTLMLVVLIIAGGTLA